jgi:hypothetical protein
MEKNRVFQGRNNHSKKNIIWMVHIKKYFHIIASIHFKAKNSDLSAAFICVCFPKPLLIFQFKKHTINLHNLFPSTVKRERGNYWGKHLMKHIQTDKKL